MDSITFYLFGDSIIRGSFDLEMGGFVNRLHVLANNICAQKDFRSNMVRVFNLGIGGNTSIDLLQRFVFETNQRIIPESKSYFIFMIGTNDLAWLNKDGKFAVSVEHYSDNLSNLIDLARKFSNEIIFLTCPPVIEDIAKNISHKGKSRTNEQVLKYNNCLIEVCKKENIPFIDLYSVFIQQDNINDLFVSDGLHPNSKGHELIFEKLKDFIEINNILK